MFSRTTDFFIISDYFNGNYYLFQFPNNNWIDISTYLLDIKMSPIPIAVTF